MNVQKSEKERQKKMEYEERQTVYVILNTFF